MAREAASVTEAQCNPEAVGTSFLKTHRIVLTGLELQKANYFYFRVLGLQAGAPYLALPRHPSPQPQCCLHVICSVPNSKCKVTGKTEQTPTEPQESWSGHRTDRNLSQESPPALRKLSFKSCLSYISRFCLEKSQRDMLQYLKHQSIKGLGLPITYAGPGPHPPALGCMPALTTAAGAGLHAHSKHLLSFKNQSVSKSGRHSGKTPVLLAITFS